MSPSRNSLTNSKELIKLSSTLLLNNSSILVDNTAIIVHNYHKIQPPHTNINQSEILSLDFKMFSELTNDNAYFHQMRSRNCPSHSQASDSKQDDNMHNQSCHLEECFQKTSGSIISEYSDVESIEASIKNDTIPLDYRLDWSHELDQDSTDVKLQYSIISCNAPDDEDSVYSVSADWDMESIFSIDEEEMEEEIAPSLTDCIKSYTWNTNITIIHDETI